MELTEKLTELTIKDGRNNLIAVTGGGGKSTLMSLFGRHLADRGMSVLITTTTKVQSPTYYDWKQNRTFLEESLVLSADPLKGSLDFYAERNWMDTKKVMSPRPEILEVLKSRYDVTIYEADGSRGLPLKIHTERDPVILDGTTGTIAVMGAQGILETVYEVTFGDGDPCLVDGAYMEYYLSDPEGLTKGMLPGKDNVILVNSYETIDERKKALLEEVKWPCPAVFCSERENETYEFVS